MNMCDQNYKM